MRTSQKSITEVCRILICSLEARAAKVSVSQGADSLLRMIEETSFSTIFKFLKPSDPVILSLKTYPICLVYRRGNVSESCLKRFQNWGIVCAGVCLTLPGSGGMGGKTGLYFIDSNPPPNLTENARCITARQNSGVSNHKGEHSAVFCDLRENTLEDEPRAILNLFKEHTRQNGRRIKEPNEPMFTLTVTDRHGIVHRGRIRRLMPVECWKLQGFTKEQFEKVAATGMSDAQLYKQAGNSITVAVVEAIARNLLKFDKENVHE